MHVQLCGCVVGRDVVKNIAPAFNTFHQSVTPIGRLKGFVNQGHHQLIQSLGDLSVQGFHVLKVAKNSAQANLRLRCDVFCRRGGVALANEMDESGNNFFRVLTLRRRRPSVAEAAATASVSFLKTFRSVVCMVRKSLRA